MYLYFCFFVFTTHRYADYYVENGVRYRTLTKAYGIKFELIVYGEVNNKKPKWSVRISQVLQKFKKLNSVNIIFF